MASNMSGDDNWQLANVQRATGNLTGCSGYELHFNMLQRVHHLLKRFAAVTGDWRVECWGKRCNCRVYVNVIVDANANKVHSVRAGPWRIPRLGRHRMLKCC